MLGVAVLGTVVSSTYQHQIAPALTGLPNEEAIGTSAEATRHAAGALHRPDLVQLANDAFVHAMHTAAGVAAAIVLLGAIVLTAAFRTSRPSQSPNQQATTPERAGIG
ncbi:hypothetical protein [Kribbella sp. VKM Ac-2566]|uniref:hypothetical protein n=1 Tax=Kribbella sp. VKM Ac-2566 TaxID=2512218 RepID=UPI00106318D4|nr:hypothetical protein [Kribbella sp. VKM Ac-2566]